MRDNFLNCPDKSEDNFPLRLKIFLLVTLQNEGWSTGVVHGPGPHGYVLFLAHYATLMIDILSSASVATARLSISGRLLDRLVVFISYFDCYVELRLFACGGIHMSRGRQFAGFISLSVIGESLMLDRRIYIAILYLFC